MENRKIVELYLNRDQEAVRRTSEKYSSRLLRLSQGIVQDLQTAEECENDTYAEAWNSIPPHRPWEYLYPFLARIIRHISLSRCRERERLKRKAHICQLSAELEQCIPGPDDCQCRLDSIALSEALNGFLGSLSREKRNIFMRRYWFLDSVADIAKRYFISESKVKTTLSRCRAGLREYLEKEGYTL